MTQTFKQLIRFSHDKRGRKVAHRWSVLAARWIRVPLTEAEFLVATGAAFGRTVS